MNILPPTIQDCVACSGEQMQRRARTSLTRSALASSTIPFLLTFAFVFVVVLKKVYPLLAAEPRQKREDGGKLPTSKHDLHDPQLPRSTLRSITRQSTAWTFATSISLSTVLAELIFCEISNSFNPTGRALALKITIATLLLFLVILIPSIEIYSTLSASGWSFARTNRRSCRTAWTLQLLGLGTWLLLFWWLGRGLLGGYLHEESYVREHSFTEGCLERIGIIGIFLMASLAGFASVSTIYQAFGARNKVVTETDVARKQAGLDATTELLVAKQSRFKALSKKMDQNSQDGFMTRVMGSIRASADMQERKALALEVSGLEDMRSSLSLALSSLQSRRADQLRNQTLSGRLLNLVNYVFSLYCIYRLVTTSVSVIRRITTPEALTPSSTDPITSTLALLAEHWDPDLDVQTWSRQISFLLSGIILLLSFNAVLQTFLFFSRFTPRLISAGRVNLPLVIAQITGVYVISSALLLRGNLPKEVGGGIGEALGAPLEPRFVDRWFEGWFLGAAFVTASGILLARRLGSSGAWEDTDEAFELEDGKRLS